MSASWRWLIAGLVAAALLLGLGWWLGHRSVTSTAAERAAWQATTDSLLGEAQRQHGATVAALLDSVSRGTSEAARLRNVAALEQAQRVRWQAEADTLHAQLVVAGTVRDSLRLYQRGVTVLDSALTHEIARGDSLAAGLDRALLATARLLTVHRIDSTRISALEHQLASAPKPARWELRLFGVRVRPAGAIILDTGGAVRVGVGLALGR